MAVLCLVETPTLQQRGLMTTGLVEQIRWKNIGFACHVRDSDSLRGTSSTIEMGFSPHRRLSSGIATCDSVSSYEQVEDTGLEPVASCMP